MIAALVMRILFDTNVLLDFLLQRQAGFSDADYLWQANLDGRIDGFITANSLTDVYYFVNKEKGRATARQAVLDCLTLFQICVIDRQRLLDALALAGMDFEDDLQISCATFEGMDAIATNDKKGFAASAIRALPPSALQKMF